MRIGPGPAGPAEVRERAGRRDRPAAARDAARPDAPEAPGGPRGAGHALAPATAAATLRAEALRVETMRAAGAARIGTGDMRREMARLLGAVDALPLDARAARVAAWVIRGELRKLEVLDGFTGGYIKG